MKRLYVATLLSMCVLATAEYSLALASEDSSEVVRISEEDYRELGYEIRPLETHPPNYPRSAAMRCIEGYTIVGFDITEHGKPVNLKIHESRPRGTFGNAGKNSVRKWVFPPPMLDGKPVRIIDNRVFLEFNLAGCE